MNIQIPADLFGKTGLTACFTGPRPKNLHGYDDRRPYVGIVAHLAQVIDALAGLGCTNFVSGGAQGIDQLAFWAVDLVKQDRPSVRNLLYIPFANQPSRWSPHGMFGQDEYFACVKKADATKLVSQDNPPAGDVGAAARMLHARNHAMVADSDFVIAFLADRSLDWRNSKGGTSECVRYAHGQDKPVLAIEYRPGTSRPYNLNWIMPEA